MLRRLFAISLMLLMTSQALSQTRAVIKGPEKANPGDLVILDSVGTQGASTRSWLLTNSDKTFLTVENDSKLIFASGKEGKYDFLLIAAGADKDGKVYVDIAKYSLIIGSVPIPEPTPGPTPDPTPVPPGPAGFRLLVIEEVNERYSLPRPQQSIFNSVEVREYLNNNCAKDTKGHPEYRFLDKDTDISKENENVRKAFLAAKARPDFKTPWVVVSDGTKGESVTLPGDVAAFLTLAKKYGVK